MRHRLDLFVVSVIVLFLELTCIRWFPSHVMFLTFFTNIVLLACFLGISVGCLAADRPKNYLAWTPVLLVLALGWSRWIDWERVRSGSVVDVGNQLSPQMVFFGAEYQPLGDPSRFVIPIEMVAGIMFAMIALAMMGPGQQLGRSLARMAGRIEAYTVNIVGSIAGILLFTLCSWLQLGPIWWFGLTLAGLAYFLFPEDRLRGLALMVVPAAVLFLASSDYSFRPASGDRQEWSPYYRIDYAAGPRSIKVNLIGHQQMVSRDTFSPAYSLPHLLNRDSGRAPFAQVLVIGAGSGNDVSRALQWGAQHVDAVEIDPVIQRLGVENHPDHPYADPRVSVHLTDGRNFLRSTKTQYDLIVYALVDSLVLHSGYSNIRLESYLFTTEAFADIKQRLKPGGLFVMYNYFRQGWIVSRLNAMLEQTFGKGNAIILNLPPRDLVGSDDVMIGDFTVFAAGATDAIKAAFAGRREYWVPRDRPTDQQTPNGFTASPGEGWMQFRPSTIVVSGRRGPLSTDSWPFLYLQRPMIPQLNLRGMAIMGVIGALFLVPFLRSRIRTASSATGTVRFGPLAQMFLLGAGFMLIETKAVVHMALLFGGTWIVNSVVFCAVLVMILAANLYVLTGRPRSTFPFYIGLLIALAVSAVVPMDAFLGWERSVQIASACVLAFTPVFFAGVVFALSFSKAPDADLAFGANIAGALFGGLSEYSSMLVGFQYVVLVGLAFYVLSWLASSMGRAKEAVPDV
jgi:spermidine synthase